MVYLTLMHWETCIFAAFMAASRHTYARAHAQGRIVSAHMHASDPQIKYCTVSKGPLTIHPSDSYSLHNAVDLMMHYCGWCTCSTTPPFIHPTPFTIKVQLRGLERDVEFQALNNSSE